MNTGNAHIERQSVDDERLDSAIDAVAREMTDVEPSGDLKARVFERIEQGQRRLLPAIPRLAWAGAVGTLVLAAATALWIARPLHQAPADAVRSMAVKSATELPHSQAVQQQAANETRARAAARPAPVLHGSSRTPARTARRPEESAAEGANVVPALAEIEPLRFATVGPDPLHVPAMEVAPLATMPSIEIPGLGQQSADTQSADQKKEK